MEWSPNAFDLACLCPWFYRDTVITTHDGEEDGNTSSEEVHAQETSHAQGIAHQAPPLTEPGSFPDDAPPAGRRGLAAGLFLAEPARADFEVQGGVIGDDAVDAGADGPLHPALAVHGPGEDGAAGGAGGEEEAGAEGPGEDDLEEVEGEVGVGGEEAVGVGEGEADVGEGEGGEEGASFCDVGLLWIWR